MKENQNKIAFISGVVLLVANFPLGMLGLAGIAAGLASGNKIVLLSSGLLYGVSWLMLGGGLWLAGKEGLAYSKSLWGRLSHKSQSKD